MLILLASVGGVVWVLAPSISAPALSPPARQTATPASDPTRPMPDSSAREPAPIEVPVEVPVPAPVETVAIVEQEIEPALEELPETPDPESVAIEGLPDGPDPLDLAAALFPPGAPGSGADSATTLAEAPLPDATTDTTQAAPRETPDAEIVHKNPNHAAGSSFGGSMANTALPFQADDPKLVVGEGDGSFDIIKHDERTHIVGSRWVIKGAGSTDDPMRVSWQMLAAAQQAYNPGAGLNDLPEFAEVINGKTVKIDGYMLLPLYGDTVTELLAMRNQWDGCCIGVPPTPYDAIEVRLAEAPKGVSPWQMNYGAITGTFLVDPFLRRNRLMGLYVMNDARLETRGF